MQDSIDALSAWLQVQLGTGGVSARADQTRDSILFRIDLGDGSPPRELEISEEALSDLDPTAIVIDLGRQNVPERLRCDPTMRLAYTKEREVPHFETLFVQHEGKTYRVVRDSVHAVRIFDSRDRTLARTPSPLPVLQVSVFKRALNKWIDDIREWRAPDQ